MLRSSMPARIDTHQVDALYEQFDRIERLAATSKTLLARRVNESREWARRGYATAAEYAAAKCGTSVGAAKDELAASEQIASLPIVEDEMRKGSLSQQQATVIAGAAAKDPKAQRRLVAKAKKASFQRVEGRVQPHQGGGRQGSRSDQSAATRSALHADLHRQRGRVEPPRPAGRSPMGPRVESRAEAAHRRAVPEGSGRGAARDV